MLYFLEKSCKNRRSVGDSEKEQSNYSKCYAFASTVLLCLFFKAIAKDHRSQYFEWHFKRKHKLDQALGSHAAKIDNEWIPVLHTIMMI